MTGDIQLWVNNKIYSGWYEQDFQRSMEDICGQFSLSVMYDRSNGKSSLPVIKKGDKCKLYLGKTLLMTGFVDSALPFYNRDDIGMKITGRDLAQDVVDSSARFGSGEWINVDFLRIATDLCSNRGVEVVLDDGVDVGAPFNTPFRLDPNEKTGDAIARAASYRGLMVFSNEKGQLLVSKASRYRSKTVLSSGTNIIGAERMGGMQNCFHTYRVHGQGDPVIFGDDASSLDAIAIDDLVRTTRELIISAETSLNGPSFQQRADMALKQRRGRAEYYEYTLDDWVQKNGKPWLLNQRVDVVDEFMGLNMAEFLTAGVRYRCTRKEGKTCVLTLKPPAAFDELPAPQSEELFGP